MPDPDIRFVQDFKDGNENNDLVRLCIEQGWVYCDNSKEDRAWSYFHHHDEIVVDTLKWHVLDLIYSFCPDDKIYFMENFMRGKSLNDLGNNDRIMIHLPKDRVGRYYLKGIEVPIFPGLCMYRVRASGRNPHLFSSEVCIGNLDGLPIHNLWRMYDMLKVVGAADYEWTRKLCKDVGKSLLTTSKRQPRRDVRFMRDGVRNIIKNTNSGVFKTR